MCGLSVVCRGAGREAPQPSWDDGGRQRPPWSFLCVLASFHLAKSHITDNKKNFDDHVPTKIPRLITRDQMTATEVSVNHIVTNMYLQYNWTRSPCHHVR